MSKISVTTIAGLTSGGDANKVKIEDGDTFEVVNGSQTINRTGNGDLIAFQKGGVDSGSISIETNGTAFDGEASHAGLKMFATQIAPRQNGADIDNTIDLGSATVRFKDIFISGGLKVGGTGSANSLDDYEEGTWVPVVKASAGGATYTYSSDYEFRLPGATSSVNAIPYTKIGNRVFIMFSIWWNTAANTRFNIDLPFAYDGSPYGLTGNATPYSIAANQGLGILGTTDNAQNFDTYTINSSGGHGNVNYPTNGEVYYFICYQTA